MDDRKGERNGGHADGLGELAQVLRMLDYCRQDLRQFGPTDAEGKLTPIARETVKRILKGAREIVGEDDGGSSLSWARRYEVDASLTPAEAVLALGQVRSVLDVHEAQQQERA